MSEGGSAVLGSFADSHLVDKIYAFYGPLIIGGMAAIPAIAGDGATTIAQSLHIEKLGVKKLGDTLMISGYASAA